MEDTGLYIYGFMNAVEEDRLSGLAGIDGRRALIGLCAGGVTAVASRVDLSEFGEGAVDLHLEDMIWVNEKAKRHFDIQQELFSMGTFIPARFCTIYKDEKNLYDHIASKQGWFIEAFEYFSDKDEWTLKIYCDKKIFMERNMDEERQRIKHQQDGRSGGASYFMLKKMEGLLEDKAREKLIGIRREIWERIKILACKSVLIKNMSRQATGRNEDMILNGALMVGRANAAVFRQECGLIAGEHDGKGLYFDLSGPWPVYNFAAAETKE